MSDPAVFTVELPYDDPELNALLIARKAFEQIPDEARPRAIEWLVDWVSGLPGEDKTNE